MANKQSVSFDLDRVIQYIGPLGLWQYIHSFLLFLVTLSSGMAVVVFAFTGFVPRYRCMIPQCENIQDSTYDSLLNFTIGTVRTLIQMSSKPLLNLEGKQNHDD